MKVILNGKPTELNDNASLLEFLKTKELEPDRIIIEYNFDIAKKEDWSSIVLKENDNIEILRFVGGG